MRTTIGLALTSMCLMATISGEGRPDFSGKWTETGVATGQDAAVMTVSQDANTITVSTPSPGGDLRWVFKLDGSESRNATSGIPHRQGPPGLRGHGGVCGPL